MFHGRTGACPDRQGRRGSGRTALYRRPGQYRDFHGVSQLLQWPVPRAACVSIEQSARVRDWSKSSPAQTVAASGVQSLAVQDGCCIGVVLPGSHCTGVHCGRATAGLQEEAEPVSQAPVSSQIHANRSGSLSILLRNEQNPSSFFRLTGNPPAPRSLHNLNALGAVFSVSAWSMPAHNAGSFVWPQDQRVGITGIATTEFTFVAVFAGLLGMFIDCIGMANTN